MKTLKGILIFATLLAVVMAGLWFYAPEQLKQVTQAIFTYQHSQHKDSAIEHAKKHSDPSYVCPMHPQIVKGEPANCPICGMDLVLKKPAAKQPKESRQEHAKKHSDPNYVCPMHPQIVKGEPGSCPICGMDLVLSAAPTEAKDDDGLPEVEISSTTVQQMGIRTTEVKKRVLDKVIRTVGRVAYNEDRLQHVHPRSSGWVEKVYVKSLGESVHKGKPLLKYYSPEINAAEKDLLIASQSGKLFSQSGARSLGESAKEKLRLLDVQEAAITRVLQNGESSGKTNIFAPQSGVVMNMAIRDGMYITPANELYTIADLSKIWVLVDVFEDQMQWVKKGNTATLQVQGVPGKKWQGKVDYIYPELNQVTRTLTIRLIIENPDLLLKPNMFAEVHISTQGHSALSVPTNALIYYQDHVRVVKFDESGSYQPVQVTLGKQSRGFTEITSGLKAGDQVVESGQFLIDSESNLQASFKRMSE